MADKLKELAESFLEEEDAWESSVFLGTVRELVDKEETRIVLNILRNEKYKDMVEVVAWDVLPIVTPHVSNSEGNDVVYKDCAQILERLAEVGNPKELILGFLEELDRYLEDTSYRTLLRPVSTVLMRFGLAKSYQLNQTFVLLHTHLLTIKLPSTEGLDEKQRRLMVDDPDVVKLGSSSVALLDFLAPFVFQVHQMLYTTTRQLSQLEQTEVENSKTEIAKFLIRMLDYPISRTDLVWSETEEDTDIPRQKSDFRQCAEQIMELLATMRFSFTRLMCYSKEYNLPLAPIKDADGIGEDDHGPGDIRGLPAMGLGCFLYLVMVEKLHEDRLPSVYSSAYILELSSVYLSAFLRKSRDDCVYKGITLLSHIVDGIEDGTLHHGLLDNSFYADLPQMLTVVMVMSPLNYIRQTALQVFTPYIQKFDWKGRYRLLRILLRTTVHAGVCSLIIGKIKDFVHHTLQHHDNEWFIGQHLAELYPLMYTLPKGTESDMLELSDKALAALNFMRYLLLRDPSEVNETSIWTHIDQIDADYLAPLHTGLRLSTAHYEFKIESLVNKNKHGKEKITKDLTVAGHKLPIMPAAQQLQVLRSGCYTYELMQSIVGRVRDIIAMAQKSHGSDVQEDQTS